MHLNQLVLKFYLVHLIDLVVQRLYLVKMELIVLDLIDLGKLYLLSLIHISEPTRPY